MSNVLPLSAAFQSCGTRTLPHSTFIEFGRLRVSDEARRQSSQVTGWVESPGVGSGQGSLLPTVQADTASTRLSAAARPAAARRRTESPDGRTDLLTLSSR